MGYHVTKERAEEYVKNIKTLTRVVGEFQVKHYPDRHNPSTPEWGVWDATNCCWVYVPERS